MSAASGKGLRSPRRLVDVVAIVAAVCLFGLFAAQWTQFLLEAGTSNVGVDYVLYREATLDWLASGQFYEPYQLAGPYLVVHGAVLYPPPILVLLVPFTVLPGPVWWIVPLGLTAAVVVKHRPSPIAWLGIAICLWYPITGVRLLHGNPGMWITAAVALATVFAWPAVLVLLKPTLLPFALIGVWRRSWWIALTGLGVVSLLFLPMWPDYVEVIRNARTADGILYSLNEFPMATIPFLAWVGSTVRPRRLALPGVRSARPAPSRVA